MGGSGNLDRALPADPGGMDVATFLSSLLEALAERSFVEAIDLDTEAVVVRGRVLLEDDRFLQVYFNERTGTTAFALIEDEERVWGIDYDAVRGWHEHPLGHPEQHRDCDPMMPSDAVEALAAIWGRLS